MIIMPKVHHANFGHLYYLYFYMSFIFFSTMILLKYLFSVSEDSSEQAYCQLLSNMKCYDLMPQFTKLIAFESMLPVSFIN